MRTQLTVWLFALGLAACDGGETTRVGPDADIELDAALDVLSDALQAPDAPVDPPAAWRSELLPADWTPDVTDAQGRFLHDFSYAGFQLGREATAPESVVSVLDFGADPTGMGDATAAIQAAIDGASPPAVIQIPAGTYRIDGRLDVRRSGTWLRGEEGTELVFYRAHDGDVAHLTFSGQITTSNEAMLSEDAASRQSWLSVPSSAAFQVGDDVQIGWVMSDAFVQEHGMSGAWSVFNGTWQPFFRRQIVAVEPGRVQVDVPLRYDAKIRDQASIRKVEGLLTNVGVSSIGISDATTSLEDAYASTRGHVIAFRQVRDGWVDHVHSSPGPDGRHIRSNGLLILESSRVTVTDSELGHAQNLGSGGHGYLFEVSQSNDVLFRDCVGTAGRHNFIQNWGFGTSGVVWLRVTSRDGQNIVSPGALAFGASSEFHHSFAMANLIDSSRLDDGWDALNRKTESQGAGHTATESVFWNVSGAGTIRTYQYGWGYVIGTTGVRVQADLPTVTGDPAVLEELGPWTFTRPLDWIEGEGLGATLEPTSLYMWQLQQRRGR